MDKGMDITALLRQLKSEDAQRAEFEKMAASIKLLYDAFITAGFTEHQAMAIIINTLNGRT